MKKLLSVALSVALLCASTNSCCFAKTAWNSYRMESSSKPISVFKQKDGEKVIVQGEESPTIVINNNNNNNNKNESKSSSSANASGGSTGSKLASLAIKLGIGALVAKFVLNKLKVFGSSVYEGVSKGFNNLKNLATNVTANITSSINENQKTSNDKEKYSEEDEYAYAYEHDYDNNNNNAPKNGGGVFNKIVRAINAAGVVMTVQNLWNYLSGPTASY